MKRTATALLCAFALSLFPVAADEPEIAYRFLGDYVADKDEHAGDKTGAYVMLGMGAALAVGSATTWFYGDAISRKASGSPIDPSLRFGLSLGFGIGGLASVGIGTGLLYAPTKNYRAEFKSVFDEDDPELREALAAATLRDLSVKGKQARITSAVSSLLIPAIGALITVFGNVSDGKAWETDVWKSVSANSWSLIGGVTNLMTKSKEELLYERYQAARDALYDPRN